MRLTLRTLLAWIDGLLPPSDRAALGDKVASSPVAPLLVERIRSAVERGPLPAPDPTARGFADDANIAAEYLDNVLPADRIEEFERICIESDLHLAEVAACHQLLADAARNPDVLESLDAAGRARLLEALRQRVGQAEQPDDAASGDAAVPRPLAAPRRASGMAWLSAAAALLLLLTLGGIFVWSLGGGRPNGHVALRDGPSEPPAVDRPADDVEPPPAAADDPDAADMAAADVATAAADTAAAEPPSDASVEPAVDAAAPMAADAPESDASAEPVTVEVAVASDASVPQGDALAIAAPAARPRPPVPPPAGEPAAAGPARPALPLPVAAGGLVLRRAGGGWEMQDPNVAVDVGDELVVPVGATAEFELDGVIVGLRSATRAIVSRDPDGLARLTIECGRAVLQSRDPAARLGVTAGDLAGVVETGLTRPLAVDVAGRRDRGAVGRSATVFSTGPVVWRHVGTSAMAGGTSDLPAGGGLAWDDVDPSAVRILQGFAEPAWLSDSGITRVDRAAAAVLAARLATGAAVADVLTTMTTDVRAEHRMLAAATLAVLGDYEPLARQLCAGEPRTALYEAQWATLESAGVPLALGRGPESAAAWDAALRAAAPDRGAVLAAMSRGYDDATLAAGTAADLVAALEAPDLAVRRFAIRALREAASDRDATVRYRADRPPTLRRDGVAWWRGQLEQGRIGAGSTPDAIAP